MAAKIDSTICRKRPKKKQRNKLASQQSINGEDNSQLPRYSARSLKAKSLCSQPSAGFFCVETVPKF
jgi:hypothetical protein